MTIPTGRIDPDEGERAPTPSVALLWVLLAAHVILYAVLVTQAPSPESAQVRSFFLLLVSMLGAAVVALHRCGLPSAREARMALISSLPVWLAYTPKGLATFMGVVAPAVTFLACLACLSVRRAHPRAMAALLRVPTRRGTAISVGIGVAAGVVLGLVNIPLGLTSGETFDPGLTWERLVMPLSPAFYEEIAGRAVFLAFCVSALGGKVRGPAAIAAVWAAMTVPHLIPHLSGAVGTQPISDTFESLAILFVVFSVPLTLLQLKRDLTAAIVAHGVIDLIRFVAFGVPV